MRTFFKLLLTGIVAILLYLSWTYWDKPIEWEDNCIEFRLNSHEYENIHVSIKGIIRKSLLRKDIVRLNMSIGEENIPDLNQHKKVFPLKFNGTVSINGNPVFKSVDYMEQNLIKFNKHYMIKVAYNYFKSGKDISKSNTFGTLHFDTKFNKMFITVYEKNGGMSYSWNGKDGKVIVSELNIEDAIELIESLTEWKLRHNNLE